MPIRRKIQSTYKAVFSFFSYHHPFPTNPFSFSRSVPLRQLISILIQLQLLPHRSPFRRLLPFPIRADPPQRMKKHSGIEESIYIHRKTVSQHPHINTHSLNPTNQEIRKIRNTYTHPSHHPPSPHHPSSESQPQFPSHPYSHH
jgi:hypothetical protein